MKKIMILVALCLGGTNISHSMVVENYDSKNNCTLTSKIEKDKNSKGEYVYVRAVKASESVVNTKQIYGFSLRNLKINFSRRYVTADLKTHVILGFDKYKTIKIDEDNKRLNSLINYLNNTVTLWDSVCVDSNNFLIYATNKDQ